MTARAARSLDAYALEAALGSGAVEVHYQPIVVFPERRVVGFEALARIRDADGTLVPPHLFVPVAESSGLIGALGHRVLSIAVAEAVRWRSGSLGTATVSVNVAPAQLERPAIVEEVAEVLESAGLPASALVLEVTESTMAAPGTRQVIERLVALGIRIAIDDFGTGFATLDTIRQIPAHVLKLDRTFVGGVTEAGPDRAIVRVVTDLADSLGMSVVAEGIETEAQAAALLRLGCVHMQGYLFARPGSEPERAALEARGTDGDVSLPADLLSEPATWPVELDEAVLSAARLLDPGGSVHRGAVHATAVALARATGRDPRTVLAVGRMALVHDLRRLVVDGGLPVPLRSDDRLVALARTTGRATGAGSSEVALVRAAAAVADRAVVRGDLPARTALTAALVEEARARLDRDPGLAALLTDVAADPPVVLAFDELAADLDRRRIGRRDSVERLRSVVAITQVLGSRQDTLELMRLSLEEARRSVGAASATLERWERDTDQLRALVNVGSLAAGEQTFPANEVYALSDFAQARRTMLGGVPYLHTVEDLTADQDAVDLLSQLGKHSSAAVPVHVAGRVWGQLWFSTDHGEPAFEPRDVETLMAVASLMGGVIGQIEEIGDAGRLAFEDPLTGLGNRRVVDDALEALSAGRVQAAVAVLDVDRLGEINDVRGHVAGDRALQQVADALARAVLEMPGATVGRLGADTFCVVLPGISVSGAHRALGRPLSDVRRAGGPSVSTGVIDTGSGGWTPRQALADADEQLQKAKSRVHTLATSARHRVVRPTGSHPAAL